MDTMDGFETTQRFQFLEQLMGESTTYQSHVLECFNQVFGYKKGIFWESSSDGSELYNPTTFNISHEEVSEYCNEILPVDPVYKVLGQLRAQSEFCYSDFLSPSDEVIREFLKRYGNKDVLSVYIKKENEIKGVLSIINTEFDQPFTQIDRERMHFLSNYISQQWSKQEQLQQINQLLQSFFKKNPPNLIIFDKNLEMQYFNVMKPIARPKNFIENLVEYLKNLDFSPLLQPTEIHLENYKLQVQYIPSIKIYLLKVITIPMTNPILTEREQQIFECLKEGMSYVEISKNLIISVNTVKFHVKNIYQKLDIKNRIELLKTI